MTQPSPRLLRRIRRDFAGTEAEQVVARLAAVPAALALGAQQDPERLQAAIVLAARGEYREFLNQLELAHVDWRDILMRAGLATSDWPEQLDQVLGRS